MKNNKKSLLLFCLLLFAFFSNAQQIFLTAGKIEFEKKVNLIKNMEDDMQDDENNSWMSEIKKTLPEYFVSYFDLFFDENKTLYKPGKENPVPQKINEWIKGPARDNIVYKDFELQKCTAQKNAFEATFLVQDSVRKVDWKITNDTRTIAGIDCRKAVAIIMDSIYVVAFYTDEIIATGGPESFNGLPGMILGIAIPRIHTTWFATKIETLKPTAQDLTAPTKGKKVTNEQLVQQLKTTMKDWGKGGQRTQWVILL